MWVPVQVQSGQDGFQGPLLALGLRGRLKYFLLPTFAG